MLPDEIVQSLPEDLRGSPAVQKYNDLGSLVKGYGEMESYQGRSVGIPGNDPKDIEAWKTQHLPKLQHVFADRLPPAKAEDYQFQLDGIDNEKIKSDPIIAKIREKAYARGLSQSQASGMLQDFVKDILPDIMPAPGPQIDFIQGDRVDSLMQELFQNEAPQKIDEYKQNVLLLSQEIPELKDLLMEGAAPYGQAADNKALSLGDHPTMVRLIGLVAKMTQPDFAGGANGRPPQSQDAIQAAAEAKAIIRNKDNPMYKAYHSGDADALAHVDQLMKKAYPGSLEI